MHAEKNFLPVCSPHQKKKKEKKGKRKRREKKERKKWDVFDAGLSRQDVEGMWIA